MTAHRNPDLFGETQLSLFEETTEMDMQTEFFEPLRSTTDTAEPSAEMNQKLCRRSQNDAPIGNGCSAKARPNPPQ